MSFVDCRNCGRSLSVDEIGLYKKMVNRGATSYLCITCLAEHFNCSEYDLRERIEYFRKMGCTLFPQNDTFVKIEVENDI